MRPRRPMCSVAPAGVRESLRSYRPVRSRSRVAGSGSPSWFHRRPWRRRPGRSRTHRSGSRPRRKLPQWRCGVRPPPVGPPTPHGCGWPVPSWAPQWRKASRLVPLRDTGEVFRSRGCRNGTARPRTWDRSHRRRSADGPGETPCWDSARVSRSGPSLWRHRRSCAGKSAPTESSTRRPASQSCSRTCPRLIRRSRRQGLLKRSAPRPEPSPCVRLQRRRRASADIRGRCTRRPAGLAAAAGSGRGEC